MWVCMVVQRFSMDNVSDRNPEDLLREIAENGISQCVCINDLGICLLSPLFGFLFQLFTILYLFEFYVTSFLTYTQSIFFSAMGL